MGLGGHVQTPWLAEAAVEALRPLQERYGAIAPIQRS